MDFMIGCNYWDREHGTDMWRCFDEAVIREDIAMLAKTGVKVIRAFPNWRDFQPLMHLYAWRGEEREYRDYEEQPLASETAVNEEQIAHFRTFADICDQEGILLIVSVVTGWMSGRLFLPHALDGKNPISDPEVLMWTARFIKGFVEGVKDCKNIIMWDLGNECNCLGVAKNRYEAYTWTAFVRNAIFAADQSRPISSGMHGLETGNGVWTIRDQGELTDYICTHPYVSVTINNDIEPMNRLRTTLLPSAQCVYYSDLSGKPAILQEQGGFSAAIGSKEMNAQFGRINLYSAFVHGVKGWLWWCGANHSKLNIAPYTWSMMERDLGLFDEDGTPRPIARQIAKAGEVLNALPFKELPERESDALCILTGEQDHWNCAAPAFVLAKQAGLEVRFTESDRPIAEAPLYLLPCIEGWSVINRAAFDTVMARVQEGATVYFSFNGGHFFHFEEYTGLRSKGMVKSGRNHRAKFPFGEIDYSCATEILLESVGAEVLARNEEENIVLSRFAYGKGFVYFLNMPLEYSLSSQYNAFCDTKYYELYRLIGQERLAQKPLTTRNPDLGLTLHPAQDGKLYAAALNYSDKETPCDFTLADGWRLTELYGKRESVPACDAAFYLLEKEESCSN